MNTEFYEALDLLQKEKGIPKSYMYDKIKAAIASTIKRDKGIPTDNVDVDFDEDKKSLRVFVKKTVVEEIVNKNIEISLQDAQQINTRAQLGDVVEVDCDTSTVGRIAAKVGKNVIVQAINEAVNGSLIQEFESRKGTIVTGVVKRIENNHTVYLEIGKYELPLNEKEQIPGEKFSDGEYVKVCVSEIRKSAKS
jgi:N utilization substance protein A